MVFSAPASRLGMNLYAGTDPLELKPGQTNGEKDVIIRAAYRQVFGNAHLMASERAIVSESQFKRGEIDLREFVRQLGKSAAYSDRFSNCPRFRQIELGYKHFLGRAPNNFSEMQACTAILDRGSFEDLIDYWVDSDEFEAAFGNNTVPYIRGYKTEACQSIAGFPYTFQLVRGPASSDAAKASVLNGAIAKGAPMSVLAPAHTPAPIPVYQPAPELPPTIQPPAVATPQPTAPTATPVSTPAFTAAAGAFQAITTEPSADICVSASSRLRYSVYAESDPLEVWPTGSDTDKEIAIRAIYRQVLGNAHIMESERLTVPESQFKQGELSASEFARQVGKSDLYRARFGNCPRLRQIELGFKHFLGRAPNSYAEVLACSSILDRGSFGDLIDFFVDSDEFQETFGQDTIPYIRGYATEACLTAAGFPYTLQLLGGAASSDRAGAPVLDTSLIRGTTAAVVSTYPVGTPATATPAATVIPTPTTIQPISTAGQANALQRVLNFFERLVGGGKQDVTAAVEPTPEPQEEFFLSPDDAKTFGNLDYMRTPKTVKRSFPNRANPEQPLEFVAAVTATTKSIAAGDEPAAADAQPAVAVGTPIARALSPTEAAATAAQKGKLAPLVSVSMSKEVSARRLNDRSMDKFRKMADDIMKRS